MLMASTNEFDVAMASIMVTMTVAIVWIIAHQWRKTRVAAYNARLKQLMIERGMSADEIERVLRADGKPEAGHRSRRHVTVGVGRGLNESCCAGDVDVRHGGS
jgi:hypothetical protein